MLTRVLHVSDVHIGTREDPAVKRALAKLIEAVGLSPLLVLLSVTGVAILFGEFAVLLAIPIAAVIATLVDVIVLDKDPAEEEVPAVIFAAKEAETTGTR